MGRIIMITGGARSGKSTFAEKTAAGLGEDVLYAATSIAFDEEMKERIRKHREQRPGRWKTVEGYRSLDLLLEKELDGVQAVLLDCLTLMVSNIMLEKSMDWDAGTPEDINSIEEDVRCEVNKLLETAAKASQTFLIVTNELGMGVVPPSVLGRAMRDIAGRANQMLASVADEVYLCVSGIPLRIK